MHCVRVRYIYIYQQLQNPWIKKIITTSSFFYKPNFENETNVHLWCKLWSKTKSPIFVFFYRIKKKQNIEEKQREATAWWSFSDKLNFSLCFDILILCRFLRILFQKIHSVSWCIALHVVGRRRWHKHTPRYFIPFK